MRDEGVHEIQLNGKQLVFMFMAVTVVAVVIFLCGVMVGRGVRMPQAADASGIATESPTDPTAIVEPTPLAADTTASTSPANPNAPISTQEKLTYADRLSATATPPETLREPVVQNLSAAERSPAEPAVVAKPPAAIPKPPPPAKVEAKPAQKVVPKPAALESTVAAGPGDGFVVQVAAVKARGEADTIAKRLSAKGFPSYVTTPGPGAARVFRVRVGKYTDRREAESVARRLEKEEQFKPWITR